MQKVKVSLIIWTSTGCCLRMASLLYFDSMPPSSRGLGHRPFKPVTAIRIRLGALIIVFGGSSHDDNHKMP